MTEWLRRFAEWVDSLGALGPLVFGAIYFISVIVIAPVPRFLMTGISGFLFGWLPGATITIIAAATGGTVAFLLARHFARARVERYASNHPRFRAVDRAVGKHGWPILLLLRNTPVFPYSVGNYVFGVSSVRTRTFIICTCLAILPGAILSSYIGASSRNLLDATGDPLGRWKWALVGLGIAVTTIATIYIGVVVRRALAEVAHDHERKESPDRQ